MNISQVKRILRNYLSDRASDKEKMLIEEYLQQAWENKELPADADIHRLVVLDNIRKAIRPKVYLRWISAAAASILILVLAGTSYNYRDEITEWIHPMPKILVVAEKFRIKKILLPDSSIAILNAGATIEYPENFRGKFRAVRINGEAYFDVVPDKHPFVIESPNLQIKVLGTSFVVTDSNTTLLPKVSVKTGKVAVAAANFTQQISADEELIFDLFKNQINIVHHQDINTDWTTKSLVFNDNSLKEVFAILTDLYKIQIRCKDVDITNQKFTGAFEANDDLDDILRILEVSYRLHILKNHDGIIIK
ncbi:DUF4974 domain-containing protein [Chitinophaga silvatica]|uniref:DUF4974 domain-containing protein n=1 Tax=Chitinophaga silvatica TaxID=2282649 RepID=A0A3E1YGV2_9BACT|nr:FecR domain-containing protein [Chitinophaga silvatica]RFS26653.1 DUF4974 domain-containing protein [Chitinophaga silvatica]